MLQSAPPQLALASSFSSRGQMVQAYGDYFVSPPGRGDGLVLGDCHPRVDTGGGLCPRFPAKHTDDTGETLLH